MRRRVSFRTVLLWVMGVGLLGFVCAAGLGRAVSLHPDQAQ